MPSAGYQLSVGDSVASIGLPWLTVAHHGSAELDLVERLRRGDLAALGEAYDEHHQHVRAFARRMLGERTTAEDLVQETFLALPRSMIAFRGDATLRSFLIGIAANHASHFVRSAKRRRAAHMRSGDDAQPPPATPEDRTARRELAEALTRALALLPWDQHVAIVLCEVEGRTCAEAATIVNAPEATVRTRVFHAKRKLRELLAEMGVK
jgi:RNA polymerase sigma-70 factor, ECF subfamily